MPSEENTSKSTFREYAETLVIAIALALFIRTFVVQAFKIPSGSMIPTLLIGDHILVNKFIYGVKVPGTDFVVIPLSKPERGDVIVFRFPKDEKKDFIKRVVGIPGDTVEVKKKVLYVNDIEQDQSFTNYKENGNAFSIIDGRDNFGPITVPKDEYFVMGDNRDHSLDSRFWGNVHFSKIRGEAFLIYWSWNKEGTGLGGENSWVRWGRIASAIR